MHYLTFSDQTGPTFPVAVLVPKLERDGIRREYIDTSTLTPEEVIAYQLHITGKKTSAADMRAFLDDMLLILDDLATDYILVSDPGYFKTLTGMTKADPYLGYVLPNAYPVSMAGRFGVVFVPNFRQVFYDPQRVRTKIAQATQAVYDHRKGHYQQPGQSIIHFEAYPSTVTDIAAWLAKLMEMPALTFDIEGYSLKHYSAGIGTISFAWNKHEGIAFAVDYCGVNPPVVRKLLIKFFLEYKGNLKAHNAGYDVGVLIFQLFMDDLLHTEGLLNGLDVFFNRSWDDTKLITYLATNSCAGNKLSLKEQAQEFAGNYAQEDIKDITKIPLQELLTYNLVDSLSTWYVYEKHYDTMVADQQLSVYEDLFKPALVDIVQMQLTGMPIDMEKVAFARLVLEHITGDAVARIQNEQLVKAFTYELDMEHVAKRNAELKKKQIQLGDEPQAFNPNSGPQLQRLLYDMIGLPVIERTDSKLPATGGDVLEKLKAYTEDQAVKDLLNALIDYKKVDKLLTSFIPAMEGAVLGPDGWHWLFGNFNLGGTISGRLSSSDPNLQNLPANITMAVSAYLLTHFGDRLEPFIYKGKLALAKLIKDCFCPPPGWLMVGLDFASLEDRISALTTKDPNKLKVYTDGFDGHSLRAQSYFSEDMPDIERAPEGAECYVAQVDGKEVFFHSQEEITYLGTKMTGAQLWDRLSNVRTAA
jgi:DNA polymerase I